MESSAYCWQIKFGRASSGGWQCWLIKRYSELKIIYIYIYIYIYITHKHNIYTYIQTYTQTHSHTHTRTHTWTHKLTHEHTHTRTNTQNTHKHTNWTFCHISQEQSRDKCQFTFILHLHYLRARANTMLLSDYNKVAMISGWTKGRLWTSNTDSNELMMFSLIISRQFDCKTRINC